MINLLSAFSGLEPSMTHEQGGGSSTWAAVSNERQTLQLLKRMFVEVHEDPSGCSAKLEIADSTMTYRHRYQTSLQLTGARPDSRR
jgi:hypothetical protein